MKNYTLFYNNGDKTVVNTDNIQTYETDTLNFYISESNLSRFNWNELLRRWETKRVF